MQVQLWFNDKVGPEFVQRLMLCVSRNRLYYCRINDKLNMKQTFLLAFRSLKCKYKSISKYNTSVLSSLLQKHPLLNKRRLRAKPDILLCVGLSKPIKKINQMEQKYLHYRLSIAVVVLLSDVFRTGTFRFLKVFKIEVIKQPL